MPKYSSQYSEYSPRRGYADESRYGNRRNDYDDDYRGRRMPPRDEEGRFMSEDESDYESPRRSYRSSSRDWDEDEDYEYHPSRSRRSRGRYEAEEEGSTRGRGHGGWFGDPEGHSQAAERGWEEGHRGQRRRRGSAA